MAGYVSQIQRAVSWFWSMARSRGIWFALRGVMWIFKTHWLKKQIEIEDRWGLYRYSRWLKENEPGKRELDAQRSHSQNSGPLFSFLLTPGNPSQRTLDALERQTYPLWQMIERCSVPATTASFAEAITTAQGDFVIPLAPGDTVSPNLLFELAHAVKDHLQGDIFYMDEDCLSEDGRTRRTPWLKPNFSPELLLSANYLKHACFRRSLLLQELVPPTAAPPPYRPPVAPKDCWGPRRSWRRSR